MLFVTNRALKEGETPVLTPGETTPRPVSFDMRNTSPSPSVFFCERKATGLYTEIYSEPFFKRLRETNKSTILIVVHGSQVQPEKGGFSDAMTLQAMFDKSGASVEVVSFIWPTGNNIGILLDYYDDQNRADQSAAAVSRAIAKFLSFQMAQTTCCRKQIDVLAHSMGNRVLRQALESFTHDFGPVTSVFRNIFMMGADVGNETLEMKGRVISESARNVAVYFASDDIALRGSKLANPGIGVDRRRLLAKRLGGSGPRDMTAVDSNVFAIDCNNVNRGSLGHAYFLGDDKGHEVFEHMHEAVKTGRIRADRGTRSFVIEENRAV